MALPAAGANSVTDAIYLSGKKLLAENIEFVIYAEATPALVDTKTVTYTIEHSDDGVTWATNPDVAAIVLTGAGSAGSAAFSTRCRLPSGSKVYQRTKCAVAAASGESTAKKFDLKAKF